MIEAVQTVVGLSIARVIQFDEIRGARPVCRVFACPCRNHPNPVDRLNTSDMSSRIIFFRRS